MPSNLVALDSVEGRSRFVDSLLLLSGAAREEEGGGGGGGGGVSGRGANANVANDGAASHAEAYFPLVQQFQNQSDPAYCGVTTLLVILNALAVDPNVRWRGGWRWYRNESMLLERWISIEGWRGVRA